MEQVIKDGATTYSMVASQLIHILKQSSPILTSDLTQDQSDEDEDI
jgi:hypothetical protein